MKTRVTILAGLTGVLLFAISVTPLVAHHDVLAMFDSSKELTITGTVKEVRWLNPHAAFVIDVKDGKGADGKIVTWLIQLAPPNALSRQGFGKDTVSISSSVSVKMWPARDGSHLATGRMLTLPNGKQIDVHDSLGWKPIP